MSTIVVLEVLEYISNHASSGIEVLAGAFFISSTHAKELYDLSNSVSMPASSYHGNKGQWDFDFDHQ